MKTTRSTIAAVLGACILVLLVVFLSGCNSSSSRRAADPDIPVIGGAPVQAATVDEGATLTLPLSATDAVDETNLAWRISSAPSNGTASVSAKSVDATVTYTPERGYTGTDSFVVEVTDENGLSDTVTINVTVEPVVVENDPPVITEGASASVTMSQNGSPTAFSLTLNATDADGDTLTWSISSAASNGAATASGTGASKVIDYTPTTDFTGADSFVVRVGDGNGGSDTITVNVTIALVIDNSPTLEGLDTSKAMILPFTVQAAYNDDTMFFQMSWDGDKGDTHDYFRYTGGAWQREGGPRRDAQSSIDNDPLRGSTSVNSTIYESRVTFMLDDPLGPNKVPMFAEFGCMLTCHDNSRAMPMWVNADGEVHKYLPDDAMFAGGRLDLWHHRLARANPIGLADDQWVGQRESAAPGEGDSGGGSRHGDAGTGPYATASFDGGTPEWVFDPATTPGGVYAFKFPDLWTSPIRFFVDSTAEFLGVNAPNAVGIPYADAIAAGYVPSEGDTVPRRRLRQTVGSRGDIAADGTTFTPSGGDPLFGTWRSNIQRALVTGNGDDTDLADGGVYNIAFAVHTGMVTVRDHYVSFAYTLSLNGGAADIQAVQIAGSGVGLLPDFSDSGSYPITDLNLFLPGITSDDFLIGDNGAVDYIDPLTSNPVDQGHGGANGLLNQSLGCRDCHTAATSDTFAPVNAGGFFVGPMETLVLQRGGVRSPTPIPAPPK